MSEYVNHVGAGAAAAAAVGAGAGAAAGAAAKIKVPDVEQGVQGLDVGPLAAAAQTPGNTPGKIALEGAKTRLIAVISKTHDAFHLRVVSRNQLQTSQMSYANTGQYS